MGWSEELPEPAKGISVLWPEQRNQGFCQILQEPALLLDSWSWALCKAETQWCILPRICFPCEALKLGCPRADLFSCAIYFFIAGACRPAVYRAEHDQQHNPISSQLGILRHMQRSKGGFNFKQLGQGHCSILEVQ